jgi:hypothetical protein
MSDTRSLPSTQKAKNRRKTKELSEVERETVRAIVTAYGNGKITLPKPKGAKGEGGMVRFAPSFRVRKSFRPGQKLYPYTAETLAEFIGWKPHKSKAVTEIEHTKTVLNGHVHFMRFCYAMAFSR